jgi:glucose dehydrogenase
VPLFAPPCLSDEKETLIMSADFLPKGDSDLIRWATNFITVANANITAINFTAGQINTITTQNSAMQTQVNAVDAKREEYHSVVENKEAARRALIATAREYNRLIQARTNVSPALKIQLGLKPRSRGKQTFPQVPTKLSVLSNSLGVNQITWQRNGNPSSASFEIWYRGDGDVDWKFLAATNKTRYDFKDSIVGVKTEYAVRARLREDYSEFSAIAVVYGDMPGNTIFLREAA